MVNRFAANHWGSVLRNLATHGSCVGLRAVGLGQCAAKSVSEAVTGLYAASAPVENGTYCVAV